jgi:predicted MFS family arabinose efflux permease
MFNAMDRQVFPALLGSIRSDYGLTLPEAGFVSTVFTVNVAIFAALSGWFMAKFGRRYVLLGGLVCYSVFTLLTPFAADFVSLTVLRALTGVGEALQVGAVFACMGAYFGARRGAAMGAMQTFFGLGAFLGPVLGTRLESWTNSWSVSFYAYGIAGIATAIVAAIVIPLEFTDAGPKPSLVRDVEKPAGSIWTRNLILSSVSFGLVGFSFFSYSALYASYAHTVLAFSVVDAGAALGMYGIGAMLGVFGGWLGDKMSNRSIVGGLLLMATSGYLLFDGIAQFKLHLLLSLIFGLTMSGFLFTRFMSVVQRSVDPSKIGYAGAVALAAFYMPGPFAGWLFGKLVEIAGWSAASLLVVVGPPLLGVVLMSLYDFSKMRKD